MILKITLSIILLIASSSAHILQEKHVELESRIIWPQKYYFSAENINVLAGFIEPFEVWHRGDLNRTRVDYYQGSFKKYYYTFSESNKTNHTFYEIYPKTTIDVSNEIFCSKTNISGAHDDILPSVENYTFLKYIQRDEKEIQVWKTNQTIQNYRFEAELYVFKLEQFHIPFKHIFKEANEKKGNFMKHIIMYYKQFEFNVTENDVMYKDDLFCESTIMKESELKNRLPSLNPHLPRHVEEAFHSYKKQHNKKYHSDEHQLRKHIFYQNWRRVLAHNSKNLSYKMEINKFSDATPDVMKIVDCISGSVSPSEGTSPFPYSEEELVALSDDLPESYDLREEGFIAGVKDQGSCSSCWAFAAVAAMEGAISKHYEGWNIDLSEQSLIDCSWDFNKGCKGGFLDKTLQFAMMNGIPKTSDYGLYKQKSGYCTLSNVTNPVRIEGFAKVTPKNPTALKAALVKYGPVAAYIRATDNMLLYESGVFYDDDCKRMPYNHIVTVVGYGERDGTPYWIVKNSWGEDYGQDGYILMSQINNNCGVMDHPYYVIVS